MNLELLFSIIFINLAMAFYSIGVWAERFQRKLKGWQAIFFWTGFICDTIGTTAMTLLAGTLFKFTFHGLTGLAAILIMLFHAIWATVVLVQKNEKLILTFHRFSVVVWIIWMIPMLSGMILGASV
ncbi:MAG: HsmA family protein [bacterium]